MSAVERIKLRQLIRPAASEEARRAWPRHELDNERVEELAAIYKDDGANALPPIEVVPSGDGRYLIADGVTRSYAAWMAGLTELPARVLPVQPGQDPYIVAYDRALETSVTSAKPLNRAEKRGAVVRLLEERPQLPDREIARLAGVSHTFVAKVRRAPATLPDNDDAEESAANGSYSKPVSAEEMAKRLVSGLASMWERKGLFEGSGKRADAKMGHRLAAALRERHGDEALAWAQRVADWATTAVLKLEAEAPAEEEAA